MILTVGDEWRHMEFVVNKFVSGGQSQLEMALKTGGVNKTLKY